MTLTIGRKCSQLNKFGAEITQRDLPQDGRRRVILLFRVSSLRLLFGFGLNHVVANRTAYYSARDGVV